MAEARAGLGRAVKWGALGLLWSAVGLAAGCCGTTTPPPPVRCFVNLALTADPDDRQTAIRTIVTSHIGDDHALEKAGFQNPSWGQYSFAVKDEAAAAKVRAALLEAFRQWTGIQPFDPNVAPRIYGQARFRAISRTLQQAWFTTYPAPTDARDSTPKTTAARLGGLKPDVTYCITQTPNPGEALGGYCADSDENGSLLVAGIVALPQLNHLVELDGEPATAKAIGTVDVGQSTWLPERDLIHASAECGEPPPGQVGRNVCGHRVAISQADEVTADIPLARTTLQLEDGTNRGTLMAAGGESHVYCFKPTPEEKEVPQWRSWPAKIILPSASGSFIKVCARVGDTADCAMFTDRDGTWDPKFPPVVPDEAKTQTCDPNKRW